MSQRLRILWVASELEPRWSGGIGRLIAGHTRALAARGHDVHLAGRARGGEPGALEGVTLHAWPDRSAKVLQLGPLVALQRELRADVVHFFSSLPHGALIVPFLALRPLLGRPKVVITAQTGTRADYPKLLGRVAVRRADAFHAASIWSGERAIAAGADPSRVHVVWNGIPSIPEVDDGARRPIVLGIGRLVRSKGFDTLIDAFDQAVRERPEARAAWRLSVVGEGSQADALRAQAAGCASADRIDFPGFVFGDEKHRVLAEAGIGAVPSRADMIPGAMLELQSYGLPIVACDIGAIAEGADSGAAARLVPGEDAPAMAKALGELMDDPALRAELTAGSRRVSRERLFSALAPQLEELYLATGR
ncbi:MAG: glycosyltransferase family 4 protein [Myxococcales bacterium]|nr:glycosyltransferase family 4 protein [Myxococcales bacterium]